MVSILVNIVKNVSSLRGDAPEWYLVEKRIVCEVRERDTLSENHSMLENQVDDGVNEVEDPIKEEWEQSTNILVRNTVETIVVL